MVAQRMGSHGAGNNSNGKTQDPRSNQLAREGSLYNLTLDEVQNQLGDLAKPLSSMNLDELLKTVFEANNNQPIEGSGPASQQRGQPSSGLSLNQQSSLNLSQDLSKKTVDEVWQHIQQEHKRTNLDRKATLGEITLEDFLVKAGIVAESAPGKKDSATVLTGVDMAVAHQAQWMNYQIPTIHPQQQQQQSMLSVFVPGHPVQPPIPLSGNSIMDAVYNEAQMTMSSSPLMGTLSDTQAPGRKRVAPSDIAEKSVERRQKRMIKNRESAARSRARKQAYTHELENKVSRLEEENERLKRQKEWERVLPNIPLPEPKYQLRRTSSAPM